MTPPATRLTDEDIERIKAAVNSPCSCPFNPDEMSTLKNIAQNVQHTEKIAFYVIVTGLVGGVLTGLWAALKYYFLNVFIRH